MEYLLKASALIALFYICYKAFLQRETFFESNRWFLLIGLFTACTIPLIVIPIYVTQTPIVIPNVEFTNTVTENAEETISVFEIISIIYLAGIVFFLGCFIIQILSLLKLFLKTEKQKIGNYTHAKTESNVSPFSFFKWIVYNPNQFKESELAQIITHEKVHASQLHSVDIIISQLATIVFWFNPFIWLYKKDLQQNLEFIADYSTQNKVNCKKSYQYLLLKSSVANHQLALTNNFYNSLIKKRIAMLHKSKSKNSNQLKYLLILPVLAIFLMSFNTKKVFVNKETPAAEPVIDMTYTDDIILNKTTGIIKTEPKQNHISSAKANNQFAKSNISTHKTVKNEGVEQMILITKEYTETDLERVKNKLKEEGLTIKFKGVKRNNDGEIVAIKIEVKSKQSNANYNIKGDEPINPIKISYDREGNNISIGNSTNVNSSNFTFSSDNSKHNIHTSGDGENEFIFTDEDGENVNVHVVKSHKNNKIHITSSDDKVIDVNTDSNIHVNENIIIEVDPDSNQDIFIVRKDNDGNIIKEDILNNVKNNVLIMKGEDAVIVDILKNENKVVFTDLGEGETLIIIDGNESTKDDMDKLDSNNIEKIEVLKGKSATEKYGTAAKDGVILITTK